MLILNLSLPGGELRRHTITERPITNERKGVTRITRMLTPELNKHLEVCYAKNKEELEG